MATGAIYNINTGLIQQTISPPLSNQAQLDSLQDAGLVQVIIPDGKNGGTGMICLDTGKYVDYAPAPTVQVPSLWVQLAAALVNKQVISAADLHPATVAEMNAALAPANMATVESLQAQAPAA